MTSAQMLQAAADAMTANERADLLDALLTGADRVSPRWSPWWQTVAGYSAGSTSAELLAHALHDLPDAGLASVSRVAWTAAHEDGPPLADWWHALACLIDDERDARRRAADDVAFAFDDYTIGEIVPDTPPDAA